MTEHLDAQSIDEDVRELEIRLTRGDVRLRAGPAWHLDVPPEADVSRQGPVLRIETPARFRGLLGLLHAVEMEVTVPPALARYDVRTTGDVELVGLAATGRVEVKAGDVTARSCAGELAIQSGAGDVSVVDHRGLLTIQSGAGDVEVREGVIERLTLQSGAGDVECAARLTGRASIATGAGDVTLRPESDGEAEIEVKSGFGDVTLHLDRVRGGRLEMRTGAGSVEGTAGIRFTRRGGIGVYSADVLGPGSGFIRLTAGAGRIRLHGEPPAGARPEPAEAQAETQPGGPARRYADARAVLEALARGEITTDEADRLLREL
ncbi:MAG: DUF4097 domain-containing protein [Chloroflexi bacterium]|nr:DUF4097 domain-containing protein [Chloroflexota bacterium]